MSRLISYRAVVLASTLALAALPAGAREGAAPSPARAGRPTARLGSITAAAGDPQPTPKVGAAVDPVGLLSPQAPGELADF